MFPDPTTGWSLGPCFITSIGTVPIEPFVGEESASTITGPEPVFPSLISAAPLFI